MALLLRVVISEDEARRVNFSEVPDSVDALIDAIKEKLKLQGDFLLQFEDPDFQNALCDLSEISELPQNRAVLHIKWKKTSQPEENDSLPLGSLSSLDTLSQNSSASSTCNISSSVSRYLRSASEWPNPFPIPSMSLNVELKLRKGNESYEKTKIGMDVSRDIKMEILDKIAQVAFDLKAYPDHDELESIACALILKYPCLTEPGKGKGYEGWLVSIRNKLNNYRAKLREAGCSEVSVNKKRKADGDTTKYTLKRPKRGEVNHVPEHPEQHNDASLEEERLLLVEATKKARVDNSVISKKMDLTFSLRRREVVEEQPMVTEIQKRWPALLLKDQICEEFFRITNKDLMGTFRAAVDKYGPKLIRLYRNRKGSFGKEMENVLGRLDDQTSNIIGHRRDVALQGLPVFLSEDPKQLFKDCLETDAEEEATKGVAVGILFVREDCDTAGTSARVQSIAVILEEVVILDEVQDVPTALAYLFGLLYAVNISYPKTLKYTFDALQHVFMEMGSDCTQRVRSLKYKLLYT